MTYDANGNTLADGMNSYVWDARNRLASADNSGAVFSYDPLGRRVSKTVLSTTTNFLYDGANAVQEFGTLPTANLLTGGVDERFTRTTAAETDHYLTDALGSTVTLTDAAGNSVAQYSYAPFGSLSASGATTTNSYTYTGRESDGLGINYYRARYYNPTTGRFLSEDPIGFAGSGPNLYGYAGGNPVSKRDPSGLDVWLEGPSGDEPVGHLSINVGNPNGSYDSYSFGVNGDPSLGGEVYQDMEHGGDILPDSYLYTNASEDALVKGYLDFQLGRKSPWRPWNSCRTFSKREFQFFKNLGIGTPGAPPSRTPVPIDWAQYFQNLLQRLIDLTTPAHH
jgi:RHS repeat-associated protein